MKSNNEKICNRGGLKYFVNLAACEYVSTLVQSCPLEFVKTLVVRLGPGEVLVVPVCTHPSCSPLLDLF